jgi:hypothetical protein
MLETVAMVLLVVWVLGLVTGKALGGAIHILLVGALVSLYVHHLREARAKARALAGSSRILVSAMGGPATVRQPDAPPKSGAGSASRPSAAA